MSVGTAPIIDRTGFLVAVGLVGGVILSDQVVYRFLVVPKLSEWQTVPLLQWAMVSLPAVLAALIGGRYLTRGQQWVVAAIAAIGTLSYLTVAAALDSPGHGKSRALEAPAEFWANGLIVVTILFIVLLGFGRIIRFLQDSVASATRR